jgi:hypothetical protein
MWALVTKNIEYDRRLPRLDGGWRLCPEIDEAEF